ncbi:hypothetical protein [Schleiferilactobacillus perolens]|uniref:Uncharacterized protein n=1 Tax=Schleiferilactobacillus perolens DSM 12744 TaxID=1423792 RepID=A0A0R1MMW4_9LACO|nr:hypothetical protein [Schleiferilactobacillus perolens]KRL08745.1 hypothetical protein FD09_GL001511 [Schleiferilactobacillus perolens DSM 12744]
MWWAMIAIVMMALVSMALVYFSDGGWAMYGGRMLQTVRHDEERFVRFWRLVFSR